ncbi:MAG: hypothetical protein IJH91_03835 [Mogibacterium sp.]|nr:hypothetical protein [Mogibacterium sp.]
MSNELIYEKKVLIRSEQVNMTRALRTSELFRLLEEASIAHTEQLGCTRHKTLDRGLLWVITRQQVRILDLPRYDEEITIRSWPGEMMHVFFPRIYEIWRGDTCLVQGEALWVLIDENERDIVDPEDYDIEIPGLPDAEDVFLPPIRMPAAEPVLRQDLAVRFSQVDINGHMNNTRYFDVIDDALGADFLAANRPRTVVANYLSELRAGDAFTLTGTASGTTWYFEGTADKPKFRVSIEF